MNKTFIVRSVHSSLSIFRQFPIDDQSSPRCLPCSTRPLSRRRSSPFLTANDTILKTCDFTRKASRDWTISVAQRANHTERLWTLVNLEMWQRHFLDGEPLK